MKKEQDKQQASTDQFQENKMRTSYMTAVGYTPIEPMGGRAINKPVTVSAAAATAA